ncbi:MAG: VWA domain-containing protein [Lachnospiraceae bacterium]|nr:VWA domain-containing protein [Lachnospiraceae bacterium]
MNKRKKNKKKILALLAVLTLLLGLPWTVYAADMKVLHTTEYEGNIYIYIRGVSQIDSDSVIQIGNRICPTEQIAVAAFENMDNCMKTLILVDNSKSVSSQKHADIKEIIQGIIDNARENELISIATFSDEITYLCDYSNDSEVLNTALNGITYQNQDTYLGDVLYNVISELKEEESYLCTRILILSDGADDKSLGYTSDEVRSYIEKNKYLIYSVGIPGNNNSAELETMFSFSRAAETDYFLLDGSMSNEDIVDALLKDQNGICLKITPDENLKDGSNKNILLKLHTAEGEIQLTTSSDMPFGNGIKEEPETETVKETEEQTTEASLPVLSVSTDTDDEEDSGGMLQNRRWLIIGAGAIVVLLVAGICLIMWSRKNAKKKAKMQEETHQEERVPVKVEEAECTVFMGTEYTNEDSARRLWDDTKKQNYLVLKNLDNVNISYKVPIVDVISIGRVSTADIKLEDTKVSRKHCEIILRGDLMYLKDCGSTNKTYYEDVVVDGGERPIVSGGRIKIGNYNYRVELIKE